MRQNGRSGNKSRHIFFFGVLFLGSANVLVKIIGLLFKIPMSYALGDEGMGYFNSAYQIYTWLYMLSTAGLPVAVSILIAAARAKGDAPRVRRIFGVTKVTFVILGAAGTAAMMLFADGFAAAIGTPNAGPAIFAIAPTLFFICISSAMRGYFQGYRYMAPPAVSQVLEALGKLLIGVLLAFRAVRLGYSLPYIAAYAVAGLAVGEAAGMFYLMAAKWLYEKKNRFAVSSAAEVTPVASGTAVFGELLRIALPITAGASVMSLTGLLDLVLVQRRLQTIGYTVGAATAFYGNYTTLVVPMFNLPPALIYPLTTALTPALSAAVAAGNRVAAEKQTQTVMRLSSLIALPAALGMAVFSRPILSLFFRSDMVERAAPLLSCLAPAVFFLSLLTVTNAVLQANGMAARPMIAMLVGGAVKLVSSYVLLGIPAVGVAGVPLSTLLCYFFALAVNLSALARHVGVFPSPGGVFFRPLLSSVLSVGAALGFYVLLGGDHGGKLLILTTILVATVFYTAAVFLTRAVTPDDLSLLPGGRHVADRLRAFSFSRRLYERKNRKFSDDGTSHL